MPWLIYVVLGIACAALLAVLALLARQAIARADSSMPASAGCLASDGKLAYFTTYSSAYTL
jgi:hypothetical protein